MELLVERLAAASAASSLAVCAAASAAWRPSLQARSSSTGSICVRRTKKPDTWRLLLSTAATVAMTERVHRPSGPRWRAGYVRTISREGRTPDTLLALSRTIANA
jgi:hypothetical protein